MNEQHTLPRIRTSFVAVVLLLAAGSLTSCGTQHQDRPAGRPVAVAAPLSSHTTHTDACPFSADAVERWGATGVDLPACVRVARARARALARRHCAVSADAAERRGARHPGNICEV